MTNRQDEEPVWKKHNTKKILIEIFRQSEKANTFRSKTQPLWAQVREQPRDGFQGPLVNGEDGGGK